MALSEEEKAARNETRRKNKELKDAEAKQRVNIIKVDGDSIYQDDVSAWIASGLIKDQAVEVKIESGKPTYLCVGNKYFKIVL
ncbi:MAG: hypothetical protein GXY22_09710 [Clostridiaceae bacterium]|nr:hypothetical protein [Clostridiaceae bacterium]